jgi:hypothetical protein
MFAHKSYLPGGPLNSLPLLDSHYTVHEVPFAFKVIEESID